MGDGEVAVELRDLLCGPLVDGRHVDITDRFDALGLTEPELEPGTSRSKAERVRVMLAALPEQDLRRVAEAVLHIGRVSLELRNRIQDILWQGRGPAITERTRRAIAAALDIEDLVIDSVRFETMLDRWWVLGELGPFEHIFAENDRSTLAWAFGPNSTEGVLRKQIRKHVFNNLGDWTTEKLFDELGTFIAVDRRFAGFIEDLSSHQAVIHEENQRRIVSAMDPVLRDANLELRVTGTDGGYPVFGLMSTGSPHARPKSVIFGSIHKPDLRVSDTVNHDLEIHDDRGNLVFDDPIGPSGLSWSDLQTWWQRIHGGTLDFDTAKKTLYKRLKDCLPSESPPQQLLFELYHRINSSQIMSLPALLPEVWLHWDHKTIQQRGLDALLGQRMDFLMLAPHQNRIIFEVDGKSHYTDSQNRPCPERYAQNTRHDRDMQLRGYTVYRFGAAELANEKQATSMLKEFFPLMFAKHGIGA
ncbi:hypothetical protein [Mycolicibacterium porcinum]|uniref:AbiJ-NTD3 domain-containing protein n=1 Tax=Mycolicibacterium porcinum TaxID=39693 RepID=A0ABV3VHB0_9MYCO